MTHIIRRSLAFLSVAVLAITVYHLSRPAATAANPSKKHYPVRGIDLSHYNKITNFDSIANNVDFIFLRASHGLQHDKSFNSFYNKATQKKVPVGAYHFFRFDIDGEAQANSFLKAIKGKKLTFPVVVDVELHGNNSKIKTKTVVQRLQAMVKQLENKGYKVMFYTNKHGYTHYIQPNFPKYPLWICSFSDPPINANWVFWQFSHSGKIKGIKGNVDLDTYKGTRKQFKSRFKIR